MRKTFASILALFAVYMATGCQTMSMAEPGMSEKAWLRRTLVADLVGMENGVRVWKSGPAYYHFRDGKLERISQGIQEVKITQ